MILMLILLTHAGEAWHFGETGVYQPLSLEETLVSPNGSVYVLNFNESKVLQIDLDGNLVREIGRKGKGPGEFTYPIQFFADRDHLYVYDLLTSSVSAFDSEGEFQERIKVPGFGLSLQKVSNGWVAGSWTTFGQEGQPSELIWYDEKLEEKATLLNLPNPGQDAGLRVMNNDEEIQASFSPIDSRPKVKVHPETGWVLVTDSHVLKIRMFDPEKRAQVGEIFKEQPRIPFDVEWADAGLEERLENNRNENMPPVEKEYPDHFPVIRDMLFDTRGHVVIDRWRGRPDDHHDPIAFDLRGQEVKPSHSWVALSRLAGVHRERAIVLVFDAENEEAGVVAVPLSELESYVEEHPIVFEGRRSRSISISM